MKDERTQFDESIREILSSTEEEVPSRVWEGIEARLDAAAASKKPAVAWWWKAAAGTLGVAAAAAAAFVVFDLSKVSAPEEAALLAEAPAQVEAQVETPAQAVETPVEVAAQLAEAPSESTVQFAEAAGKALPSKEGKSEPAGSETGSASENAAPAAETLDAETPVAEAPADQTPASDAPIEVVKSENKPLLADASRSVSAKPSETTSDLTVDNSDIEAVYGKEEASSARRAHPLELTLGANSGAGPQKNSSVPRLYAKGTKSPSATTVVENANPDSYNIPLSFGVGVKFRILPWLSIGTGVNYTLLGKKVSATYSEVDDYGNLLASYTTDMKNTQHYIGVPLDVYFRVFGNKNWEAYALVGGTVEKCIVNHYGGKYEGTSISYNKKVSGVQTSVKAGFGVEYSPVDFLGIYIDPSVRYYFNNSQPRSIRTAQPLAFGLEAGIRFKI